MKPVWQDAFYDKKIREDSDEKFAETMGKLIREDVDKIYWAIMEYDLRKAMSLINEMKQEY